MLVYKLLLHSAFTTLVVYNQWTGLLDWNTAMDCWTDIFWFLHIFV